MRGSVASSSYNAFNVKFQTQNLHNTGLSLIANYTWSHSFDDLSTTFGSDTQGGSGYIGSLGYTDLTQSGPRLGHLRLQRGKSDRCFSNLGNTLV